MSTGLNEDNGYFSEVYYPKYDLENQWYGDMFSIPQWNKIEF